MRTPTCAAAGFFSSHRHRQAVDEAHQVGPARLLASQNGELRYHQEVVAFGLVEVHQLHAVAAALARDLHLDRHAAHQRFVEGAVALDQRGVFGLGDLVRDLVENVGRRVRVEPGQGLAQFALQQHLAVIAAFRGVAVGASFSET